MKKTRAQMAAMGRLGGNATHRRHPELLREIAAAGGRATKGVPKKPKPSPFDVPAALMAEAREEQMMRLEQILGELDA